MDRGGHTGRAAARGRRHSCKTSRRVRRRLLRPSGLWKGSRGAGSSPRRVILIFLPVLFYCSMDPVGLRRGPGPQYLPAANAHPSEPASAPSGLARWGGRGPLGDTPPVPLASSHRRQVNVTAPDSTLGKKASGGPEGRPPPPTDQLPVLCGTQFCHHPAGAGTVPLGSIPQECPGRRVRVVVNASDRPLKSEAPVTPSQPRPRLQRHRAQGKLWHVQL